MAGLRRNTSGFALILVGEGDGVDAGDTDADETEELLDRLRVRAPMNVLTSAFRAESLGDFLTNALVLVGVLVL